jgi:AcrR family transcriptional regulator
MLRAAIEVFAEEGYVGARMADIAARAGVAVQTVYFVFHTKPELLQACFDHAVLGPERLIPPEQPLFRGVANARSGRTALRSFVAGNTAILERVATTDEVARAALHEPEAAAVVAESERLRREGYREMLASIAERFALRPGMDLDEATDIMLMFGSSATYLSMVRAGWSQERFEDWLTDTLARTLLARPGR